MADHDNGEKDKKADLSRRRFMKNTGIAVGGVAGGSLLGGFLADQFQSGEKSDSTADQDQAEDKYTEARMFFTRFDDFVVLEQATERLFPENDDGPGAIELGVPYFIDKQLAGTWGINGRDYRHGPFAAGRASVQHSSLNRGEVMKSGIRKMNQLSQKQFDTSFDEAEKNQQIDILKDFENGDVNMRGVSASSFFGLLRDMTLEGAYADPLYGGNRRMKGWEMKNFPGAVTSYKDIIEDDEFVKKQPISLTDYQQKS